MVRCWVAIAATLFSQAALAGGLSLSAETGWSLPLEGAGAQGLHVGGFVGYGIGLGVARFTPEVGASFYLDDGTALPKLGARLTTGALLRPGVYGHVLANPQRDWSPGWDLGASLDLAIVPTLRLGAQAGVLSFATRGLSLQTGVHVGLQF